MNAAYQRAFNDAYDAYLDSGEWLEYCPDDAPEILRLIRNIATAERDDTGELYTTESRLAEIRDLFNTRGEPVARRCADRDVLLYLEVCDEC